MTFCNSGLYAQTNFQLCSKGQDYCVLSETKAKEEMGWQLCVSVHCLPRGCWCFSNAGVHAVLEIILLLLLLRRTLLLLSQNCLVCKISLCCISCTLLLLAPCIHFLGHAPLLPFLIQVVSQSKKKNQCALLISLLFQQYTLSTYFLCVLVRPLNARWKGKTCACFCGSKSGIFHKPEYGWNCSWAFLTLVVGISILQSVIRFSLKSNGVTLAGKHGHRATVCVPVVTEMLWPLSNAVVCASAVFTYGKVIQAVQKLPSPPAS